jgi:hypothetical protein
LVGIWDPISLTVTLPPPGSLAGCSAPFKIVVNYTTGITLLNPQGTPQTCEYDIEIIDVGLKLPDLIDKANKFTISVSPLATEKILAGEPAVLDLIWPEIPGVNFMDRNGTLLKSHTDHMMQKASILSRELRMIASYRGKKKSINNILKTVAPARKILYNRITAEKALERSPSTMAHMKTYHGKDRVKFPKTIPPGGADITVNI